MAMIWMDPWETGHVGPRISGNGAVSTSNSPGTWRTYTLLAGSASDVHSFTTSVSEIYFQGRAYMNNTTSGNFVEFRSPNNTVNIDLFVNAGTKLDVRRGSTTIGTGITTLITGREYYIQGHLIISDTVGVATIKLDGTTEIDLSAQDTRNDAAANGDKLDRIAFTNNAELDYFADWIVNDTSGATNTTYPANLGIEALLPSAAGDNTGLTPTAGSNFQCVDERPPNDVTDYAFGTGTTVYDLYNIPSTQWTSVSAVGLSLRCASSDAGAKNVAHIVKADTDASGTADTEYTGSDLALSTTWQHFVKYYDQQPDSTNWTPAKVNALQIGAKAR